VNPLALLAIGGIAILAMSGRKRREGGAENGGAANGGNGGTTNGATNGNGGPSNGGGTPGTDDLPGPDTGDAGTQIPPDLLAYFSEPGDPKAGTFYPVSTADLLDENNEPYPDPIKAIANQMLFGQRQYTAGASHKYAKCINDSDWNGWLYGEESNQSTAADGVYASKAFDYINDDALADIVIRKVWPKVGERGQQIMDGQIKQGAAGDSLGLLWLPPADIIQPNGLLQVECPVGEWTGGNSTTNPPDAILRTLSGTAPDWRPTTPGGGLTL
jgi:hypothetical protein